MDAPIETTPIETIDPAILSRREYFREYQRKQYWADLQKGRSYKKSMAVKKKLNLGYDVWGKYKHHLADVLKLREIVQRLPREFLNEVLDSLPAEVPAEVPAEETPVEAPEESII